MKIVLLSFLLVGVAVPAAAQQKLSLRVGDIYPVGHYIAEALIKPLMADVKARLGDRIDFQYYPAEQLGKGGQMLTLTQQGVLDIGMIVPPLIPDKFPRSSVAELPGSFTQACAGTMAFWSLAKSGGVLADKEFAPNGVRVLVATVLPPYQILLRSPIEGVKSFAGQKIYSTGGAKDLTVRRLGGVPTRMTTSEVYESMSRGTIDGGLMSLGTALAYRLPGLVKHATLGENFGSGVITYSISIAKWNALPADVRQAFDEAGEKVTRAACQTISNAVDADIARLKAAGVSLTTMPQGDRETIDKSLASVAEEWAKELDDRRLEGSAILTAFRAALKNN